MIQLVMAYDRLLGTAVISLEEALRKHIDLLNETISKYKEQIQVLRVHADNQREAVIWERAILRERIEHLENEVKKLKDQLNEAI